MIPDTLLFDVPMVAILACMALSLWRSVLGPLLSDRILALNTFGTKTVLLIAVLGFLTGRPDFLDLAIVYALMNFIATLAVLRFSQYRHLAHPDEVDELEEPWP